MEVGPFQRQRPEQRDEGLRAAACVARRPAAGARSGRTRMVGIVRVESLRHCLRGDSEGLGDGVPAQQPRSPARRPLLGPMSASTSASIAATNAAPQPPGRPGSPWRALDGELSARGSRSPAHSRFLVGERVDVGLDRRLQRCEQRVAAPARRRYGLPPCRASRTAPRSSRAPGRRPDPAFARSVPAAGCTSAWLAALSSGAVRHWQSGWRGRRRWRVRSETEAGFRQ